ncbi:hypothetical protein M8C21_022431 [Ambrosia artemisiifolia]|uniref:F-box domain, Leucine-rich repeat domain, L domain-like protein n=1 Tax=Ambrosia artemisiifolia TaxID=4212 RepID=A0AAD5D2K0_AMBAR|nr:hypothetical protein M8C21_022431 [Ambrosia artemisiifolia]
MISDDLANLTDEDKVNPGYMNAEGDRLSVLSDDLIHRILSLINIKYAIQTSVLSSRWRFLWTSMTHLNISTDGFRTVLDFSKFVNNVLSHRNDQTEVHSVNLNYYSTPSEVFLKTVLDYAFSHNIQQLTVAWLYNNEEIDFPYYLLCSQSLKYLRLTASRTNSAYSFFIILASTWDLPALTTLRLDYVGLYDHNARGIFSKCANLKNLTISNFNSHNFTFRHPQLSNLTLENGNSTLDAAFNVVAPQLKNLTIRRCWAKHLITAPNLVSLFFSGNGDLQFSTDLYSLEKVDLGFSFSPVWSGSRIGCLLQQLRHVKFLTLNLELVKPLSAYMEQLSVQPSPFSNLKSLKIYPLYVPPDDYKVTMCTKVLKYLLDGSPSATLTMISYEEIEEKQQRALALKNAAKAFANASALQNLMSNFHVLLDKEKSDIETRMNGRRTSVEAITYDQGKTQVENMQLHLERKMSQMKSCWKDVGEQIDQSISKTRCLMSKLREIEVLLLKDLPTSKRDKLQACFSSLRVEAEALVKRILHQIETPQIQLSGCINELATISLSSS